MNVDTLKAILVKVEKEMAKGKDQNHRGSPIIAKGVSLDSKLPKIRGSFLV